MIIYFCEIYFLFWIISVFIPFFPAWLECMCFSNSFICLYYQFCHEDEKPTNKIYEFYYFQGTDFFIYLYNCIDFSVFLNLAGFPP